MSEGEEGPNTIAFSVMGHPVPEGALASIMRNGRCVGQAWANGASLLPWRRAIASAWRHATVGMEWDLTEDECYIVEAEFYAARPKAHERMKSQPTHPISRRVGDIDKLSRGLLDALTGWAWKDDSQVVRLVAEKRYSAKGIEGARITIARMSHG